MDDEAVNTTMETREINPVIAVVIGVVVLGLAVFFGFRLTQPPTPAANSYTPGVPPWQDPKNASFGTIKAPPAAGNPRPR